MSFRRYLAFVDRIEHALAGLGRCSPEASQPDIEGLEAFREAASNGFRLFPIVGPDLCFPVASALAHGRLDDAARLVPSSAWQISRPLYG